MIALLVVCGHIAFNAVAGWALLSFCRHERTWAETLSLSVLLGVYAETLSVATLMFLGVSLTVSGLVVLALAGGGIAVALHRGQLKFPRVSIARPQWYEVALLITVGEKVLFTLWQLTRTHTYFDDALTHWSGRARSLFGGVNWSLDRASPFFMAGHVGSEHYPLQTTLWRVITARLSGEWNEVLSRADGLLFFVVLVGAVWLAVWRFSNIRWLAAGAAFTVSAVPLHVWHAAAGYSDIAVEAFAVAALAALLRGEWLLGGVMAAGTAWSKNDGLALYFPALLIAAGLLQGGRALRAKGQNVGRFLIGSATLAPWLVFKYVHALGVSPGQNRLGWHPDAPGLFWNTVMMGPTSGILWICVFACAIWTGRAMFRDTTGRALLAAFLACLGGILFVFGFTDAYAFLKDQTTIHRSMMQFSGVAILIMTYGIWLKLRVKAG
ncbi:MAG: hypothetical protein EXS64_18375 [Candidatus Latescibacteria bacterium]|nr:hypothetical protein [Candidatus Latescibacterota bacterium]